MAFKIFRKTAADLMSTRLGFLLALVLPIQTVVQSTSKLAFPRSLKD